MSRVARPETQVDDVDALRTRPFEGADDGCDVGRKSPVENVYCEKFRVGRLLADGAGDRGAVAKVVNGIGAGDADAAGDAADVWVLGINAAIDDGNLHADAASDTSQTVPDRCTI